MREPKQIIKRIVDLSKLAPDGVMGEPLSVHYSGGDTLSQDITDWLELNKIPLK